MIAGSNVNSDKSTFTNAFNSYMEKVGSITNSTWNGTSYDRFKSQVDSFKDEYMSTIESSLSSFASACDDYISYEAKKKEKDSEQAAYDSAMASNDSSSAQTHADRIAQLNAEIEALKQTITSHLSDAGKATLTATVLADPSASSSTTGADASGQTTTTGGVTPSEYAIEPHSRISESERNKRIAMLGGSDSSNMTKIEVPYWDGSQERTMTLTVNKNIAQNYQNAFREIADMKWTINPSVTAAYNHRTTRSGSRLSDHAYGGAVDVNWDHNFNTGDGSSAAVRGNEAVIEAFARQGFYWGGDWKSSKDDMHFTFTGW